jgi:hypothetical protein
MTRARCGPLAAAGWCVCGVEALRQQAAPKTPRGVMAPLRPALALVPPALPCPLLALIAITREGQAVRLGQAHAVPHSCQACQTQRRSAAGCTPKTRATSPTGQPAPTSPTACTRTDLGSVHHDPPPSRPPRPPGWPEASELGVGPPPLPPVPRCVLLPAAHAGCGRASRVPVRVAGLCSTGMPAAAADPAAAGGVGGWAASQASTAAIASVCSWSRRRPASPPSSCTSMVNPGGPGRGRRGRRRRWPAAAWWAAGVGPGGSGRCMHGSLLTLRLLASLASSTAELHS